MARRTRATTSGCAAGSPSSLDQRREFPGEEIRKECHDRNKALPSLSIFGILRIDKGVIQRVGCLMAGTRSCFFLWLCKPVLFQTFWKKGLIDPYDFGDFACGLLVGGAWIDATRNGRWASIWFEGPSGGWPSLGLRCGVPLSLDQSTAGVFEQYLRRECWIETGSFFPVGFQASKLGKDSGEGPAVTSGARSLFLCGVFRL